MRDRAMPAKCKKCGTIDASGATLRTGSSTCDPRQWERISKRVALINRAYSQYQEARRIKREADQLAAKAFREGSQVYYRHGNHLITATVVRTNDYGRIYVRGSSGKEYWLEAERVAGDMIREGAG
jgi:predicted  nucleic acid-binding Zn-ribbon protein